MHQGASICPSNSMKGGIHDADGAVMRRGKGGPGFCHTNWVNIMRRHRRWQREATVVQTTSKNWSLVQWCRRAFDKKRERGAKTGSISNLILMSQHERFTMEPKGSLARPHPHPPNSPAEQHGRYTNAGSGGSKATSKPCACNVMNSLCPETPPTTNVSLVHSIK